MKYRKKVISNAPKCYSLAPFIFQGRKCFLVATEKLGPCQLFDEGGNLLETVWEGPGGVMTMVQVPGREDAFLATQEFYSPNDSANARIVLARRNKENDWSVETLAELPFVHRFGILHRGGVNYLLACCLKSGHSCKDDWSKPGKVVAAILPDDITRSDSVHPLAFTEIMGGMGHNHGYSSYVEDGIEKALVTCDEGVFSFEPPVRPGEEWKVSLVYGEATSDAVLVDLDADGVPELGCLAPFHGNSLFLCKKNAQGLYEKVWTYEGEAQMLHATCACRIQGKNTWVVGCRKGKRELLAISWQGKGYQSELIDADCGSANVMHYVTEEGKDVLVSANREIDEAAIYFPEAEEPA